MPRRVRSFRGAFAKLFGFYGVPRSAADAVMPTRHRLTHPPTTASAAYSAKAIRQLPNQPPRRRVRGLRGMFLPPPQVLLTQPRQYGHCPPNNLVAGLGQYAACNAACYYQRRRCHRAELRGRGGRFSDVRIAGTRLGLREGLLAPRHRGHRVRPPSTVLRQHSCQCGAANPDQQIAPVRDVFIVALWLGEYGGAGRSSRYSPARAAPPCRRDSRPRSEPRWPRATSQPCAQRMQAA